MKKPSALNGMGNNQLNNQSRTFHSSRFPERVRQTELLALVFLLLWLGGVGCALCCASDAPEACSYSDRAVASRHACGEPTARKARATFTATASTNAAMHCCLMNSHASSPAVLPQPVNHQPFVSPIIQSPVACAAGLLLPPVSIAAPPLNKGSTYLRGCALLI